MENVRKFSRKISKNPIIKKKKTCKIRVKSLGICKLTTEKIAIGSLIRYFTEDDVHLFLLRKESELP